jgi:hypothetical protein
MFVLSNTSFNKNIHLTKSLDEYSVKQMSMAFFDKEGYALNHLEEKFYRKNNVKINYFLYIPAAQYEWYYANPEPYPGPYFDHCMLLERWDYQEHAREQIERHTKRRPVLKKLLKITPKWGIDLAMEYMWENGDITEVFHIEIDKRSLEEIQYWKEKIETLIKNNDWHDVAKSMEVKKDEWINLCSDDQSDWRCNFLGLPRAYDNLKVL